MRNSSLLINLAKAIGRLVVSYKEVQNLAGYTTLINEMEEVLDDLSNGRYQRVMVTQADASQTGTGGESTETALVHSSRIAYSGLW